MEAKNWLDEMSDYAEVQLEVSIRERNDMVDAAYRSKPWTKGAPPHDWAEEFHRERFNEDGP